MRRREGSAAVEFAFVALPFFIMLFGVFQLGFVLILSAILENAAIDAGRLVRTGQAQAENFTDARFKSELCDRMSIFKSECETRATVDVRVVAKFTDVPVADPTTGATFNPAGLGYDGGGPQSLVVVRVWYAQPLFAPGLTEAVSNAGPGKIILTATTAFRNEPF
jgi:Flp pilus assembly protein TadG